MKKEYSQLEAIFARSLGLIQGNFLNEIKSYLAKTVVFNVPPTVLFWNIFKGFGIKSKRIPFENYVLPYHTTNAGHAEIF